MLCAVCFVYNGHKGDYGESGSLLSRAIYNFIALDVVMGFNFLHIDFVCDAGDELYNF